MKSLVKQQQRQLYLLAVLAAVERQSTVNELLFQLCWLVMALTPNEGQISREVPGGTRSVTPQERSDEESGGGGTPTAYPCRSPEGTDPSAKARTPVPRDEKQTRGSHGKSRVAEGRGLETLRRHVGGHLPSDRTR